MNKTGFVCATERRYKMTDTTKVVTIELTLNELWWIRQAVESDRRFSIMRAVNATTPETARTWNQIADRYDKIRDKIYRYQKGLY